MKKMLIVILIAFIGVSILTIMFTFQASSKFRNFSDDDDDDDDDDKLNIDFDILAFNLRIVNFTKKVLVQIPGNLELDILNNDLPNIIHS